MGTLKGGVDNVWIGVATCEIGSERVNTGCGQLVGNYLLVFLR